MTEGGIFLIVTGGVAMMEKGNISRNDEVMFSILSFDLKSFALILMND